MGVFAALFFLALVASLQGQEELKPVKFICDDFTCYHATSGTSRALATLTSTYQRVFVIHGPVSGNTKTLVCNCYCFYTTDELEGDYNQYFNGMVAVERKHISHIRSFFATQKSLEGQFKVTGSFMKQTYPSYRNPASRCYGNESLNFDYNPETALIVRQPTGLQVFQRFDKTVSQ